MGVAASTNSGRRVVRALLVVATFAWGFGFYGIGFFLRQLQAQHRYSLQRATYLTFGFYLLATVLSFVVSASLPRVGPKRIFLLGAIGLAIGVIWTGRAGTLALSAVGYVFLAVGWSCSNSNPISATVFNWYPEDSGPPLTLALTGASLGGIGLIPLLTWATSRWGLAAATTVAGVVAATVLLPLIALVVDFRGDAQAEPIRIRDHVGVAATRPFLLLVGGLGLAIAVQVGFLVHHLNLLSGLFSDVAAGRIVAVTTLAALAGRFGFARLVRRFDAAGAGLLFLAVQILALLGLAAVWPSRPGVLGASLFFGLGVGVLITTPPLMVRRLLAAVPFGAAFPLLIVGYQLGIALGPLGATAARNSLGGYRPVMMVWAMADVVALGLLVLARRCEPMRPVVAGGLLPASGLPA